MIPELGHFALILALCFSVLMALSATTGTGEAGATLARRAAAMVLLLSAAAAAALVWAFASHDLSVRYVASNSHATLPLGYRLAAMWSSHEGSMLLWVLTLSGWTAAVARASRATDAALATRLLCVLGLVQMGLLLFVLLSSNPFVRLLPSAPEGADLNALLQDPGMAFHPPALYLGYVGFAVPFAFAVAVLWAGRMPAAWLAWLRPWVLCAWAALTVGIVLGSHWAYRVLGWGGWWFWDPVENASLLPWLTGLALLHLMPAAMASGAFKRSVLLLCVAGYALSLIGTFIVRSGAITSVHAFATDPRRGVFILALLVAGVGTALLLYGARAGRLGAARAFAPVSRETFLLLNAMLFAAAAATVLIATLYPMALEAFTGARISVGAPYFEAVLAPLLAPAVFLMVLGPLARWRRSALPGLWHRLRWAGGASLAGVALLVAIGWGASGRIAMALGAGLGCWAILGTLAAAAQQLRAAGRAAFTRGAVGMWTAHLGVGLFVLSLSVLRAGEVEREVALRPGQHAAVGPYRVRMDELRPAAAHNHDAMQARLSLLDAGGRVVATLRPESRRYRTQDMTVSVPAIDTGWTRDVYVALGSATGPGSWGVRLQYKPMMSWLWVGFLLAAAGAAVGAFAALPRQRRGAAPSPAPEVPQPHAASDGAAA